MITIDTTTSNAEKLLKNRRSGIKTHPDVDEKRPYDRHKGQEHTGGGAVTLFQKLGQSGDAAFKIKGGKNQAQKDQGEGRHPLEVTPHQAVIVAGSGQAYQMDGGDVRSKKSRSYHPPRSETGRPGNTPGW